MELVGEQLIAAPRARVWGALHDPAILRTCIPGCEEVTRLSDSVFEARVLTRVGPLKARFSGRVEMTEIDEPKSCVLVFEGGAGSVGMAHGRSRVQLDDISGTTRLTYAAEAAIGGKLGQIGGRLVEASARKIADDFFRSLNDQLGPDAVGLATTATVGETAPDQSASVSATDVASASVAQTHAASVSRAASSRQAAPDVFSPGWSGEFQRVLWVVVGILAGVGLAHLMHL